MPWFVRKSTSATLRPEEVSAWVIKSTASMHGDLQGIAGRGFNEIEGFQIALLPTREEGINA